MQDTNAFNRAGTHFLTAGAGPQHDFFTAFPIEGASFTMKQLDLVYQSGLNPLAFESGQFPEALQRDYLSYRKAYQKKPMVAGALSLAVPGLGKLYAGRTNSFIATILSQTLYGFASYESIRKLGPVHPVSMVSIGFFGVFYISNIYGSIHAVKQAKQDYKKQYLSNAGHYYHLHHTGNLY